MNGTNTKLYGWLALVLTLIVPVSARIFKHNIDEAKSNARDFWHYSQKEQEEAELFREGRRADDFKRMLDDCGNMDPCLRLYDEASQAAADLDRMMYLERQTVAIEDQASSIKWSQIAKRNLYLLRSDFPLGVATLGLWIKFFKSRRKKEEPTNNELVVNNNQIIILSSD